MQQGSILGSARRSWRVRSLPSRRLFAASSRVLRRMRHWPPSRSLRRLLGESSNLCQRKARRPGAEAREEQRIPRRLPDLPLDGARLARAVFVAESSDLRVVGVREDGSETLRHSGQQNDAGAAQSEIAPPCAPTSRRGESASAAVRPPALRSTRTCRRASLPSTHRRRKPGAEHRPRPGALPASWREHPPDRH